MSLQDRNLVSRKTAQELQRLILRNPGTAYSPHPARGGARGRMPVIVKCLSDTATGGGGIGDEAFDAVMIAGHGTVASASQPELTPVWLTLWGDALGVETPTEDAIYHGIFAGDFDPDPGGAGTDRRPRVFAVAPPAGGGSIQVEDVDESPSVSNATQLRFDSADGFAVSTPGAGVARVDMLAATTTQAGVVSLTTQQFAGDKGFVGNVEVGALATPTIVTINGGFADDSTEQQAGALYASGLIRCGELYVDAPTDLSGGTITLAARLGSINLTHPSNARYMINNVGGATGTFTTTDGKTVTVAGGIITAIV